MKAVLISALLFVATASFAKDYQVTGPIVEVTDTKIVVDKKGEKFEIAKSAATPAKGGELKVGEKVTVYYTMAATEVEVKGSPAKKKK